MLKTLTITCFFSCLCLSLCAQELIANEKLVGLSAQFGFSKSTSEVPEIILSDSSKFLGYQRNARRRSLDFSFLSARLLSKRWNLGVGLTGSFERSSILYTYASGDISNFGSQEVIMRPHCFVQYFYPINKRFLITGKFQTGFDLAAYRGSPFSSNSSQNQRLTLETIVANLRLSPSFVYLLHPRVLLELDLGHFDMYGNVKSKQRWFEFNVRPTWSNVRLWWRFDKKAPPQ